MLNNVQQYLQIIYVVSGVIVTAASFLIPLVKTTATKRSLKNAIKIAEAVRPYIIEAEKFTNYKGSEKLNFVITKANQYAIKNNIQFDEDKVKEQIEELVILTKSVNQREKDKPQPKKETDKQTETV